MKTENKLKLTMCVATAATVLAVALASVSMLLEFETDIGFFALFSPLRITWQVLTALLIAFAVVVSATLKRTETFPVINYDSTAFRFFASMTACLSLLCAYVEITTLIASLRESSIIASKGNIVVIFAFLLAVASFFVYINYCFGKNDKKSEARGLCGMLTVGYLIVHLMETHVLWSTPMNDPVKVALQIAILSLIMALTYTFKCEFPIDKASGKLRIFFMLVCPILTLTFSVPAVIAYYARVYTNFNLLVDAIYVTCACGFVLASYMPVNKAQPIAAAEWAQINAENEETAPDTDGAEPTEDNTETEEQTDNEE
jgi:hypothetical protein